MANWSQGLDTNLTYVYAGTGSMFMQLNPSQTLAPGTYYQLVEHSREIGAYPGQVFTLSAVVRTDGTTLPGTVAATVLVYFRVEYSDATYTEFDCGTVTGLTAAWQAVTVTGTVPTPTGKTVVGIGVYVLQQVVVTSSWVIAASVPFVAHLDNIVLGIPATGTTTGGNAYTVANKTSSFTAVAWGIYLADSTSGNITVTLPAAGANANTLISIKRMSSANTVTIVGSGSDTVEGAANLVISYKGSTAELVSDSTANWALV